MRPGRDSCGLSCAPVRSLLALGCIAALGAACAAGAATQTADRASFTPRSVASGFSQPIFVTGAKGEPGRLYVVEQGGRILVLAERPAAGCPAPRHQRHRHGGRRAGTARARLPPVLPEGAQALRPVHGPQRLDEARRVPDGRERGERAAAALLEPDPYGNHNGGMLAFGPNGRLYFTMGDGGAGGDPENRAQNMRSLFGKLLSHQRRHEGRQDRGARPPQRLALLVRPGERRPLHRRRRPGRRRGDRLPAGREPRAGELRLGRLRGALDVRGQGARQRQARDAGGQYSHSDGCSVTGGYVYRGSNAALRGRYIYGDYCSGNVWSFKISGGKATGLRRERFRIASVSSFGQDTAGELYGVSHGGTIYRLTP